MPPGQQTLHWRDLRPLNAGLHVARHVYLPSTSCPLHGHDFAEICWVVAGRVRHLTPSAQQDLGVGDVVMIEPGHRHRLEGVRGGGVLINVALSAAQLRSWAARWAGPAWSFAGGAEPARGHFTDVALAGVMGRVADVLTQSGDDALARDLLMGEILAALRPPAPTPWHAAPPWLAAALSRWSEPRYLRHGVAALPRLTGRSREHVSRAIRRACGCSPTLLLQELRLRAAEAHLRTGDDDLATVAAACGYQGRAHFHRLFRARYGVTPGVFRRQTRQTLLTSPCGLQ